MQSFCNCTCASPSTPFFMIQGSSTCGCTLVLAQRDSNVVNSYLSQFSSVLPVPYRFSFQDNLVLSSSPSYFWHSWPDVAIWKVNHLPIIHSVPRTSESNYRLLGALGCSLPCACPCFFVSFFCTLRHGEKGKKTTAKSNIRHPQKRKIRPLLFGLVSFVNWHVKPHQELIVCGPSLSSSAPQVRQRSGSWVLGSGSWVHPICPFGPGNLSGRLLQRLHPSTCLCLRAQAKVSRRLSSRRLLNNNNCTWPPTSIIARFWGPRTR